MQQLGLLWQMDKAHDDLPWVERPDPGGTPLVQIPPSRFYDDYTFFVDWTVNPRHAAEFFLDFTGISQAHVVKEDARRERRHHPGAQIERHGEPEQAHFDRGGRATEPFVVHCEDKPDGGEGHGD